MVNTRKIADEYRLAHWAKVMQERTQSGLSIKAFCRQINICTNTYYYWQRKLREAACREFLPAVKQGKAETEVIPNGWAVCEVEKIKSEKDGGMFIEIGKSRISINADIDQELLSKVCKVLMALC